MGLFRTDDGQYIITENSEILNKRELMSVLGISRPTIQRWIKQGLPCIQYANNVTGFNLSEVEEWLKKEGYPPKELMKEWEKQRSKFREKE